MKTNSSKSHIVFLGEGVTGCNGLGGGGGFEGEVVVEAGYQVVWSD